jgi:hypothetical protein
VTLRSWTSLGGTISAVPCEGKMCLHRCFSLLFLGPFFNVFKPINTAVQLLKNNSSHGSFQLGGAGMGKSHCEQSVLFTCNMGTDYSSTSTCINSH